MYFKKKLKLISALSLPSQNTIPARLFYPYLIKKQYFCVDMIIADNSKHTCNRPEPPVEGMCACTECRLPLHHSCKYFHQMLLSRGLIHISKIFIINYQWDIYYFLLNYCYFIDAALIVDMVVLVLKQLLYIKKSYTAQIKV